MFGRDCHWLLDVWKRSKVRDLEGASVWVDTGVSLQPTRSDRPEGVSAEARSLLGCNHPDWQLAISSLLDFSGSLGRRR
jgi:hypothetical protein